MPDAPLAGVRVLDLTRYLAGPFATMLLGDYGADVVKVESPKGREFRPPGAERDSYFFLSSNRNKRSLTLDIKTEAGRELFERLLPRFDVVVENFRPGVMRRLGLDYERVREIKPDIIYCSVSGFGQDGPKSGLAAYDGAVQASSGIMSVTGTPESGPIRAGFMVVDMSTAVTAAFAIAAALYRRQTTGRGQYLDVAMNDTAIAMMNPLISRQMIDGTVPPLIGNLSQTLQGTADTWPTADGHFAIAVINDRMIPALCEALDRPAWAEDPRYKTAAARVEHQRQFYTG